MPNVKAKSALDLKALGEDRISRLVLRFSSATLVSLLLNALYGLSDALFVSWGVGDNAMGGVSVVFPFILLQSAVSTAVGGGAASLVSRRLGEGDASAAGEVTINAMSLFYGSALLLTVLGFVFLDPLLSAMGVTAELYPYAREYFMILLAGNVFSTGFSSIIRAEGKMLYALLIWVIPITINIALDALFILVFGWGVRGSATSTVACQFASFSMSMLFFSRFSAQTFKGVRLKARRMLEVLAVGLPSLVQVGSLSIISALLNHVLASSGGAAGVTAYAYISRVFAFALVPFTAVTQALAPILGYNYGAKNHARVKSAVLFCAALCLFYALFALLALEAFPRAFIGVFTKNEALLSLGENGLRIMAASLVFAPFPILAGAAFQAVGQKTWALVFYAANLVFLVPATLVFAKLFGVYGVWWAYVLANALAACAVVLKLWFMRRAIKAA